MVFRVFLAAQKRLIEASVVTELDKVYQQRLDGERRFDTTEAFCTAFVVVDIGQPYDNVAIVWLDLP